MDDIRAERPVRPNLWADRLTSYAFSVEAAIGRNPMRYLLARRFDAKCPTHALTLLFVVQPKVLSGTYVQINEGPTGCEVQTYLPTMSSPMRVAEGLVFDTLPLTDVGYVDLMAWPHPGLRRVDAEVPAWMYRYEGPPSVPELSVHEEVDPGRAVVTRRVLFREGRPVRRWEITEHGGTGRDTPPRRIQVARPQTGHETEFVRTSPAVTVPPDAFDDGPEGLRERVELRLIRE